jgi:hypothetical protein
LNPDELANQDIKSNIFRSGRPDDKPKLMGMLRVYRTRFPRHKVFLRGFLQGGSLAPL